MLQTDIWESTKSQATQVHRRISDQRFSLEKVMLIKTMVEMTLSWEDTNSSKSKICKDLGK